MVRWQFWVPMTVLLLVLSIVAAQNRTDFSGHWSLVTSQSGGGGGGRSGSRGNEGVKVSYVSGAAINCGIECTIVQDPKALKILGPVHQQGMKFPDVVLSLDGRESTVAQFLKTLAKWDGDKLVVTSSMGSSTATQTMSVEDGKLTIVTIFNVEGFPPLTLTYVKR